MGNDRPCLRMSSLLPPVALSRASLRWGGPTPWCQILGPDSVSLFPYLLLLLVVVLVVVGGGAGHICRGQGAAAGHWVHKNVIRRYVSEGVTLLNSLQYALARRCEARFRIRACSVSQGFPCQWLVSLSWRAAMTPPLFFFFFSNGCAFPYFLVLGRRKVNKGIGVELMHYLNDGLWKVRTPLYSTLVHYSTVQGQFSPQYIAVHYSTVLYRDS